MYKLMLCHTITVQFPSEVHFILGDDVITSLSNPVDPKWYFSAGWHVVTVVTFKATALHWWKTTQRLDEWQSFLTVKCTYVADAVKHLLTAGHNSFPKHSGTQANKTRSVFHLSEFSSVCVKFYFPDYFHITTDNERAGQSSAMDIKTLLT